jgi:hypothetical protein
MGNKWVGGENECATYWQGQYPNIKKDAVHFWCLRFLDDNGATKDLGHTGPHGWGYPDPFWPDLPYMEQYNTFDDVAGHYFGGRGQSNFARCYGATTQFYGMDRYHSSDVWDNYCYGSDDTSEGGCGSGFFDKIGCGITKAGGSFGDFLGDTLPRMFKNGLNSLGAGSDLIAFLLGNWIWILGFFAVLMVVGVVLWALK